MGVGNYRPLPPKLIRIRFVVFKFRIHVGEVFLLVVEVQRLPTQGPWNLTRQSATCISARSVLPFPRFNLHTLVRMSLLPESQLASLEAAPQRGVV